MRLNMKSVLEKPVKINKGISVVRVTLTVLFLIVVTGLLTSKLWLPDSRVIMNMNNDIAMTFSKKSIQGSEFYLDREKEIGEVSFMVTMDDTAEFDDLSFNVTLDNLYVYENGVNFKVIKGSVLPTTDDTKFQQEILLQFAVPDTFYYFNVGVMQADNKQLDYQLDYRNFIESDLSIKESGYLTALDDINIKIIAQTSKVQILEKETKGLQTSIEVLSKEIDSLKIKIKTITDEKALKDQESVISIKSEQLEDNKAKFVEKEEVLNHERSTLEQLEQEKAKQR